MTKVINTHRLDDRRGWFGACKIQKLINLILLDARSALVYWGKCKEWPRGLHRLKLEHKSVLIGKQAGH